MPFELSAYSVLGDKGTCVNGTRSIASSSIGAIDFAAPADDEIIKFRSVSC
jgi:hypothetical protein